MAVFDKKKLQKVKGLEKKVKKHTIMIVDDEEAHLTSLENLLSDEYHIFTSRDGQEALDRIKAMEHPESISVVIADQRMPNLTGLQLFEKIKDIIPNTIRIILTAYDDKDVIIDSINKAKIYEFILKTFDPEDLKLRVKGAVEAFEYRKKSIEGHPVEIPPVEIVKKGKTAIKEYFESLIKNQNLPLNEIKVLLVGDGGAGKTSLVKRLMDEGFDKNESPTHGINIKKWNIKVKNIDIKAHIWDFGGQEIMHATHQFFLSRRSLYIMVLDSRKDEKTEYWLKHIESFGGNSPVLIVINKIDENPSFDINRPFLQDKYKNIRGLFRISCAENKGIKEFSQALKEALVRVEMIKTTWAISWFGVKSQLENMQEHFISYEQYQQMCEAEEILDIKSQDTLLDFLNDLGVVLHLKDFELLDTHVLEPKWITEAVYKIINSERLAECKGLLNLKLLDKILEKKTDKDYYYPRDKYKYIITLMKKFEICYEIDDENVLITELLEVQEPSFDFDYNDALKFIIQYEFLPRSVMPRFIVNMHKDIKNDLKWRTGVVLEDTDFQSTAVIKADHDAKRIYIYVNGRQKRDYFAAILIALRRINKSLGKLETTELVPLPDDPEKTVEYAHLIRLEEKGIEFYLPGQSKNEYKVKYLLGTITREKATEEEILQLLRKIKSDTDTIESLFQKANDSLLLQPNIMGVGINLNNLIQKVLSKKGKNKKEGQNR